MNLHLDIDNFEDAIIATAEHFKRSEIYREILLGFLCFVSIISFISKRFNRF